MKKFSLLIILGFVVLGSVVRCYGFFNPLADWHSWRQSDTASVARNFIKFGFDPLRPRFDDLSNIPSGKDNPQGYRMVEFPLYQLIGATLFRSFHYFSIEGWLRILSILASAGTILLIGLIVSLTSGTFTGILAAGIYALLPYNIYYGRTILPDTQMVFWSLLSIYSLMLSVQQKKLLRIGLYVLSSIIFAIALLTKPVAIFLLLPVCYIFLKEARLTVRYLLSVLVYSVVALAPLLLWRQWILQFPEGIAVYTWLFNDGNIRFKGAWWYWIFSQRIGNLILGYWGLIPFGVGLISRGVKKESWFFRWWLFGAIAYLIVIARGNVQHDYYQILILPVISIYVAKGVVFLVQMKSEFVSRVASILLAGFCLVLAFAFSWYTIRTYYWINRKEIVDVGKIADQILPKNAKVIAPYGGDTTFLYQINRQGWPIGFDIAKKISMGAMYYVTVSATDSDFETKDLARRYTVIARNDTYAIIDLTKPRLP